ncbi:hypothetical protein [Nocardioides lianchengensis]|uniref:Virginiamycin B lyase n=1 Tax=Nocardioides lianchengensis TaxID=1045774 RepID=A0A1G6ZDI5_9ACTN|nr:hypothetical protein [Nocardioides lianchengensis]NYG11423.1 virginiamycin B lyase [Nocardioides lianchengensis]SDE00684.1 virginiamycin B lyase [Nocardioides lianchengensis]
MDTRATSAYRRTRRAGRLLITGGVAAVLLAAQLAATPATSAAEEPEPDLPTLTWTTHPATPTLERTAAGVVRRFPVPTSTAGLGRIRTAPNGDMWFTMEDANKIGRITPAGRITEYTIEDRDDIGGGVPDLAVAADGTVWIIWDHGRRAFSFRPSTNQVTGNYSLGSYPYGKQVAIGPGQVPWITMSYDDDGLARIVNGQAVWLQNAPPCDGAIAYGRDGAMWCQADDTLIRSNANASAGTTYPLPDGLADPYSLAAGPNGSVWFARYDTATWFTSADEGDVGWIDHRSGATRIIDTGDKTAPKSLTYGPDRKMWFTSVGRDHAIGHVDARGRGALVKVGNYEPEYLTFSRAGDVWFTDEKSNSIVQIARRHLQRTNVDPGRGSVFKIAAPLGKVKASRKPIVARKGRVPVRVACPKGGRTCRGTALLQHPKRGKAWTKKVRYAVKPGKQKTVQLRLTKAGLKAVRGKPKKARVTLTAPGAKVSKQVRVRR